MTCLFLLHGLLCLVSLSLLIVYTCMTLAMLHGSPRKYLHYLANLPCTVLMLNSNSKSSTAFAYWWKLVLCLTLLSSKIKDLFFAILACFYFCLFYSSGFEWLCSMASMLNEGDSLNVSLLCYLLPFSLVFHLLFRHSPNFQGLWHFAMCLVLVLCDRYYS